MPLFIGGYARTGTTLMQGLICSDDKAFPVTKECTYFSQLVKAYKYGVEIWDYHTDDYFETLEDFLSFHKNLINQYLIHTQRRFGIGKEIVQKDPLLTNCFPEVLDLIYDSRFVVMVRDPRDAIASQIVRGGKIDGFKRDVQVFLNDYGEHYRRVLENRNKFAGKILFVCYEKLVSEPENIMINLREFTGLSLPINPRKDGWQTKREASNESASALDCKPVSNVSVGKYKKILSKEEQRLINSVQEPVNDAFGFNVFLVDEYCK